MVSILITVGIIAAFAGGVFALVKLTSKGKKGNGNIADGTGNAGVEDTYEHEQPTIKPSTPSKVEDTYESDTYESKK